jgi:hypothetical protein
VATCTTNCITGKVAVSSACARCYGVEGACAQKNCLVPCAVDSSSAGCTSCLATHCDTAFQACTGALP